jgi:RNA polymerase sigma-70 factor (ECF subfamily)
VDRKLVERARAGDQDAYEILARERARPLLGVAYRILRDQDAAEDAVQATLVRIWRELPRLRDPDRFEAWSLRIVVRASLDAVRANRWHRSLRIVPAIEPSTPDVARAISIRDELDGAFGRLSPEHRAVVVLHHHLGYSLGEIAEILGVPYGTVGSRLHHALRELRSTLSRDERLAEYEGRTA